MVINIRNQGLNNCVAEFVPFTHKEGSKAFARYRDIDEDMKKELVSLLD